MSKHLAGVTSARSGVSRVEVPERSSRYITSYGFFFDCASRAAAAFACLRECLMSGAPSPKPLWRVRFDNIVARLTFKFSVGFGLSFEPHNEARFGAFPVHPLMPHAQANSPWWLRQPGLLAGTEAVPARTRRNWEYCGCCTGMQAPGNVPYPP